MPQVEVEKLADHPWEFKVRLQEEDELVGEYLVEMTDEEYERYGDHVEPHELINATFAFLLAREEPEMISAQFQLSEVEKHYPEYPDDVHDYL